MFGLGATRGKVLLPLAILVAGAVLMLVLGGQEKPPLREERPEAGHIVEVLPLEPVDHQVFVSATGVVRPAQEISLIPQVNGRIIRLSPHFVEGGFLQKDEMIAEIEDTDYRLAFERAEAALVRAKYDLEVAQASARVARAEWERSGVDKGRAPSPLALHEPQLKNARAALGAAQAALAQTKLDWERTKLKAPFDAVVRSKAVDLGQFVRSGTVMGILTGTDRVEIPLSLSLADRQWLKIPRPAGSEIGSRAEIILRAPGVSHVFSGRIVRSGAEVDPQTRMLQVIVAVLDPYGLRREDSGARGARPALAVGSFVEASLEGRTLTGVFVLPSLALRENSTVWLMNAEGKLEIREITLIHQEKGRVLVREGLQAGEKLVLTNIAGAAAGMRLRPAKEKTP
jgi:RND family efflux transporter MFP subunit